jgi:hypothetical protein
MCSSTCLRGTTHFHLPYALSLRSEWSVSGWRCAGIVPSAADDVRGVLGGAGDGTKHWGRSLGVKPQRPSTVIGAKSVATNTPRSSREQSGTTTWNVAYIPLRRLIPLLRRNGLHILPARLRGTCYIGAAWEGTTPSIKDILSAFRPKEYLLFPASRGEGGIRSSTSPLRRRTSPHVAPHISLRAGK